MESVVDISSHCWLRLPCVDEAFVAGDWDFDVAFCKAAPELLDERDYLRAYYFWCFGSYIEVFAEEWSVFCFVVFYADEVRVAIVICQWRSGGFPDNFADTRLMEEFEIAVDVDDVGLLVKVFCLFASLTFWNTYDVMGRLCIWRRNLIN
jgi:hypothetical protein